MRGTESKDLSRKLANPGLEICLGDTYRSGHDGWFWRVKTYYVYILTNRTRTLYIGVTSDLLARLHEHRSACFHGFASKYKLDRLIYYEEFSDVNAAIAREKQLKGWRRERKIELIESLNPHWRDLSQAMLG